MKKNTRAVDDESTILPHHKTIEVGGAPLKSLSRE
jgi:hypothetical protein